MLRAPRPIELKPLPRRLIPRFRLRSLLVTFAVLTVAVAGYEEPWRRQAAAVARLAPCAKLRYTDRWPWLTYPEQRHSYGSPPRGVLSKLFISILGQHGAFEVYAVDLESDGLDEPAALGDLPTVTELEVHSTLGTGPRLKSILTHTPNLKELYVSGAYTFTPDDVRAIGQLRQIGDAGLNIADDDQCAQCLREIARLHDVCWLHVQCSRLSPEIVRSLTTASAYEEIDVWYDELPDMIFVKRLKSAQPNCKLDTWKGPPANPYPYGIHVRFWRDPPVQDRTNLPPYDPLPPCDGRFPGHFCLFGEAVDQPLAR